MTTPPLLRVVARTLDLLATRGVRFALLGGFAVREWGIPRPTYDLDLAVTLRPDALPALLGAFREAGFEVPPEHDAGFLDAQAGMPKLRVLRADDGHLWEVDLFLAATPFLRSAMRRARMATLLDRRVRVFTPEDIILLKLLAARRKDLADVEDLLVLAGPLDRARMRRWADGLGILRILERSLREADGRS